MNLSINLKNRKMKFVKKPWNAFLFEEGDYEQKLVFTKFRRLSFYTQVYFRAVHK